MLLLPQRYVFSSKSQHKGTKKGRKLSCCCYHKGTYFQANHNTVVDTLSPDSVVVATTKVRIFKQITTDIKCINKFTLLLLLPQRYVFSSKSQLNRLYKVVCFSCCCYHKGTYFQANHNERRRSQRAATVVVATTKVRIFKQITTWKQILNKMLKLLLLPQRYVFSSKSQLNFESCCLNSCCCCYHKGTYFQANHNLNHRLEGVATVVVATTKVRIFKQITTSLRKEKS